MQPTQPEAYPTHAQPALPDFGSPEHVEWLVGRMRRNQDFRRQVEAAEREALREYHSRRKAS